jgi:predicted metalloendopeptidase
MEMEAKIEALTKVLELHSRVLGCFCECLAMNAENSVAVMEGRGIPYPDAHYYEVMQKWNILDNKGNPTIL